VTAAALVFPDAQRTHRLGTWTGPADAFARERVASVLTDLGGFRTHAWPGQGFSAIAIERGQTIVIHTWPEHRLATIDVLAASAVDATATVLQLEQRLGWTRWAAKEVARAL
jgi:S-adenosylmethionine/arginine decarboxylase-like enzyme